MTRIIAGNAKGHRLTVPHAGTRPTSDRVREAVFSTVEAWLANNGRTWSDSTVVDLYAGSGALGFEAWSRGAGRVVLVESSQATCRIIRRNQAALDARDVMVECGPVERWVGKPSVSGIDMCFVDPPYDLADEAVGDAVSTLVMSGALSPVALLVIERRAKASDPFPAGVGEVQERRYGDTRIWYGRVGTAS